MDDAANYGLFGIVCLVWGSTWIATRLGVLAVPPLFFVGTRFLAAGLVLLALAALSNRGLSRRTQYGRGVSNQVLSQPVAVFHGTALRDSASSHATLRNESHGVQAGNDTAIGNAAILRVVIPCALLTIATNYGLLAWSMTRVSSSLAAIVAQAHGRLGTGPCWVRGSAPRFPHH